MALRFCKKIQESKNLNNNETAPLTTQLLNDVIAEGANRVHCGLLICGLCGQFA